MNAGLRTSIPRRNTIPQLVMGDEDQVPVASYGMVKGMVVGQPGTFTDFAWKKAGPVSPTNVMYSISHRSNNKDYYIFGFDGAEFHDYIRLLWDTKEVQIPNDWLKVGVGATGGSSGYSGTAVLGKGFLELYAPEPFVDFHYNNTQADFDVRLINNAVSTLNLRVAAGGNWGVFRIGTAGATMGAYGWDSAWAHFGHWNAFSGSNEYAFMSHSGGEILINARNNQWIKMRHNAGDKVIIQSDGLNAFDWIRARNSGVGIYFAPGGGGWYQNNGDGWMYVYGNKPIYTADMIRGGSGYVTTWNGAAGHGVAGCDGASTSKGWMTRNDGNTWGMFETQLFMRGNDGGDYFNFYRFGDIRLNVPTVAPGDPDLRIAGSHQLLRNASNRRFKKNIRPLQPEENLVWNITPVLYHWADDNREHGARFNERHPNGCPGFIAEDLFEAAPDACTVDTMTGEPNGPDNWALLAYLVAGLKEVNERLQTVEAVPSVAASLKKKEE